MTENRRNFIGKICATGACMCGFSAIASPTIVSPKKVSGSTPNDSNHALMQEWIASLLANLKNGLDSDTLRNIIKKNALVHYNNLGMDNILKEYENKPEKFIAFIEEKWGWKIDYRPGNKSLLANENKNYCVCPMVNRDKGISSAICYCSEGFAEMMFTKVLGKQVSASVISSIQRGDKNCQYKIEW